MFDEHLLITENPDEASVNFLFRRNIAMSHYVSARVNFFSGLPDSACLLAQQSIEIFIKGIFSVLEITPPKTHNSLELLNTISSAHPKLSQLQNNPKVRHLLSQLSNGYRFLRYGQAKSTIDASWVICVLDETVLALRDAYVELIKEPKSKFFVPENMQTLFLKDNKFFKSTDIVDHPMASYAPFFPQS